MKLFLVATAVLVTSVLGARADEPEAATTTPVAARAILPGALKTVWAKDLKAPQGLARDKAGNIYVAEFGGGRIAKLSPQGALLQRLGKDLKSPAFIRRAAGGFLISERKANRVLFLSDQGKISPIGGEVIESLGLATSGLRAVVIAHTTSRVLELTYGRWQGINTEVPTREIVWKPIFEPSGETARYGYRCLALDRDGSLFISDEIENRLLLLTPNGRLTTFARDLDDPTGVTIADDGTVYVAEEGAGGRVARLDREGNATTVVEGLGKPRDILFLDGGATMLVSDREGGRIWRIVLPPNATAKAAAR